MELFSCKQSSVPCETNKLETRQKEEEVQKLRSTQWFEHCRRRHGELKKNTIPTLFSFVNTGYIERSCFIPTLF